MTVTNWAGNHSFTAPSLVEPRSIDELVDAVRSHDRVRALGTRHSFNDLADTEGVLVSTGALPAPIRVGEDAATVTVGAGARYGVLAEALEECGWALHNMGSLPHISVGGAISTGTHGSGNANGSLSTAVAGIRYVDGAGDVQSAGRGDPDFAGMVVGLGAFGIITEVTLDIQPSFRVHQDTWWGIGWDAFLDDPDALFASGYSVSVLTHWGVPELEHVWVKSRLGEGHRPVPESLLGGRLAPRDREMDANLTPHGSPGPWSLRLPHFRLDSVPSRGDEIQTEYFVARADAQAALRAVRDLADEIDPILSITELRTLAADDLWLSGAHGRDALGIHFTWLPDAEGVARVLPVIEAALSPFGARPHWGKVHRFDADDVARVFPRSADAAQLFARLDPDATFANAHLRRLGLR